MPDIRHVKDLKYRRTVKKAMRCIVLLPDANQSWRFSIDLDSIALPLLVNKSIRQLYPRGRFAGIGEP